jgi:hypothetical protein
MKLIAILFLFILISIVGKSNVISLQFNNESEIENKLNYLDSIYRFEKYDTNSYLGVEFNHIYSTYSLLTKLKKYKFNQLDFQFEICKFDSQSINTLYSFPELIYLSFNYCTIGKYTYGISSCINLQKLQFNDCEINEFPQDISELINLEYFRIRASSINNFIDFSKLKKLKELEIYVDKPIQYAFDSTMCELYSIEGLVLFFNSNDTILQNCIGALPNLEYIYLYHKYPPISIYKNELVKAIYVSPTSEYMLKYIIEKFNEADRPIRICIPDKSMIYYKKEWVKSKSITICNG